MPMSRQENQDKSLLLVHGSEKVDNKHGLKDFLEKSLVDFRWEAGASH